MIKTLWENNIVKGGIVLLLFALLTVFFTWPLASKFDTQIISGRGGDPYFVTWVISENLENITNLEFNEYWDTQMFYPYENSLLFSDHSISLALQALPLYIFTQNLVIIQNWTIFMGFFLSGIGGYLFGKLYFKNEFAALASGFVVAFNPYHFGLIGHLQIFSYQFIPFLIFFLERFLKTPTWRNGLLFALFFALNAHVSIYLFIFSLFIVGFLYLARSLQRRKLLFKKEIKPYLLTTLFVAILVIPLYLPYISVSNQHGVVRDVWDSWWVAAWSIDYVISTDNNFLWGLVTEELKSPIPQGWSEKTLYFGVITLFLSALSLFDLTKLFEKKRIALSLSRKKLFYIGIGIFSFVFAMGPFLIIGENIITLPFKYLYDLLFFVQATRAPTRIHVLTVITLAVLVGAAIKMILDAKGSRWNRFIVGIIFALLFLEAYHYPFAMTAPVKANIDEYQWIQDEEKVIAHYPFLAHKELLVDYEVYNNPTLNGTGGLYPPSIDQFMKDANSKEFLQDPLPYLLVMKELGVDYFYINSQIFKRDIGEITQVEDLNNIIQNELSIPIAYLSDTVTVYDLKFLNSEEASRLSDEYRLEIREHSIFFVNNSDAPYANSDPRVIEVEYKNRFGIAQVVEVLEPVYIPSNGEVVKKL